MSNLPSIIAFVRPAMTLSTAGIRNTVSGKETAILLSMLITLCMVIFHKFIFGFSVYLFKDIGSDTLNFYYPSYISISQRLREGAIPGWSFEQGLGQNIFPFSLSDPTTYLLYLLGGDKLSYGLIWVEIFKIICSGLLFFFFLKELNLSTCASYIGGMLYAFSGYMIVGGGWYVFSALGLYLALILLSVEMLYAERNGWLFPIAVSLIASYSLVSLYTCSLFLLLYVIFRVSTEDAVNVKKLVKLLRDLLLLGTLGLLISAVFSLPNLLQMVNSPRVSGNASYINELISLPVFELGNAQYLLTLLMRTFSSDLLGNGSAYKGWSNYLEAPLSYCGLISLILIPQIFVFSKNRQRMVYGLFIGIFIFSEIFPWFRRGFWLFQGDYFRDFSLYLSIVFILLSVFALDKVIKGGKVKLLILGASIFTLLLLLYFPYDVNFPAGNGYAIRFQDAMDHGVQAKVALFLISISAGLIFISIEKYKKYAQIFLLILTFSEVASFSYDTVNKRNVVTTEELHQKVGYNDYSVEAIAFIRQQDKEFFRVEKNYGSSPAVHMSLNDSKVHHYFGSSSYHSFNQLSYIDFLSACDIINARDENETRWAIGVRNEPLLQMLTGVRYLLIKGDGGLNPKLANTHKEIGNFGGVRVFKSQYALPMGVAYDTYIVQSDFNKLDKIRKQIALLKSIMVPDSLAVDLPAMTRIFGNEITADTYNLDELVMDIGKLKSSSLRIEHFSNSDIDGKIDARIRQLVFFSIPFDSGWKASVNGKEVAILRVDGGLSAILIEPGSNAISLHYSPPFVAMGLCLTLLGLLIFGVALFRMNLRALSPIQQG